MCQNKEQVCYSLTSEYWNTFFLMRIHTDMYPVDRRTLAVHIYSLLKSLRKTATMLQVSHSTISRWLKNPIKKPYRVDRPLQNHP